MKGRFDMTTQENRGFLFKSDRKSKSTDRDYSGSITLDGREYWLSGWIKKSKAGASYLSLSLKAKEPAAGGKCGPGIYEGGGGRTIKLPLLPSDTHFLANDLASGKGRLGFNWLWQREREGAADRALVMAWLETPARGTCPRRPPP
jgi:hypothetical protein